MRRRDAHVGALAAGVSADDYEIGAGPLVLVGNPGRDHGDVARVELHPFAGFAAEPYPNRPGGDTEHLVCRAVIMVVRINPVAPGAAPAIGGKEPLAFGGAPRTGLQRAAIDNR